MTFLGFLELWVGAGFLGALLLMIGLGRSIRPYTYGHLGVGVMMLIGGFLSFLIGFIIALAEFHDNYKDVPIFAKRSK